MENRRKNLNGDEVMAAGTQQDIMQLLDLVDMFNAVETLADFSRAFARLRIIVPEIHTLRVFRREAASLHELAELGSEYGRGLPGRRLETMASIVVCGGCGSRHFRARALELGAGACVSEAGDGACTGYWLAQEAVMPGLLTCCHAHADTLCKLPGLIFRVFPYIHRSAIRALNGVISGGNILSCRENEVLHWISMGKSNWEISKILGIGERTVKFHVGNMFAKLGVNSRAHAIAMTVKGQMPDSCQWPARASGAGQK